MGRLTARLARETTVCQRSQNPIYTVRYMNIESRRLGHTVRAMCTKKNKVTIGKYVHINFSSKYGH